MISETPAATFIDGPDQYDPEPVRFETQDLPRRRMVPIPETLQDVKDAIKNAWIDSPDSERAIDIAARLSLMWIAAARREHAR